MSNLELLEEEIAEVAATLRSGWLTTGPKTSQFESDFAQAVGAEHAIAVNSCTAALHLASVALGLKRGEGVLVPTMTFVASAEIVRYAGALPILVDCRSDNLNLDLGAAANRMAEVRAGRVSGVPAETEIVAPVSDQVAAREAGNQPKLFEVPGASQVNRIKDLRASGRVTAPAGA